MCALKGNFVAKGAAEGVSVLVNGGALIRTAHQARVIENDLIVSLFSQGCCNDLPDNQKVKYD